MAVDIMRTPRSGEIHGPFPMFEKDASSNKARCEKSSSATRFLPLLAKATVAFFFGVYLCVGLFIYRDYGLSWDEQAQRKTGAISALYVNARLNHLFQSPEAVAAKLLKIRSEDDLLWGKDPNKPIDNYYSGETLLNYVNQDNGVFFQLLLVGMEAILKLEDSRDVYLMRHLGTFLLFYVSAFVFYLVVKNRFSSWPLGLLGSSFLIFSPRIFADSFYNCKDLAFLSLFVIATYSLMRFWDKPSLSNAVFHAVTNAAAINVRIAGVLIPAITVLVLTVDLLKSSSPRTKLKRIPPGVSLYLCLLPSLTILWWPYLWEDPVGNFVQTFRNMSHFRWNSGVLYLGEYVTAANLPWHYIPVWIAITTPPFYLACFIVGLYYCCRGLWKNRATLYSNDAERQDLVHLLLFFVPLVSVIVLKSVLYDGWRHLFFVYPSFLCIAITGFIALHNLTKHLLVLRWGLLGTLIFGITNTGYFLVREHPHQQVYFNIFGGPNVKDRFELDYWGLAYRQGLEYVLKNDSSPIVKVNTDNFPGKLNAKILTTQDRRRLRYVPLEDAEYFLSNLRGRAKRFLGREYYSIKVNDVTILVVYKLR